MRKINIAETVEDMIKEKLSHYENIKVDVYEDSKYEIDDIENAFVIQISAFNVINL